MKALVIGFALAIAGCSTGDHVYICRDDQSCVIDGVQGICVAGGAGRAYCAFADSKCPSGYRWDDSAPPVIDGQCVPFLDGGAGD
ncbi:MAG TPA: hypothetical protein VFF06_20855 [Polyangia bacterium]|nr:hypothetical protein [Polyangia bacterium]